MKYSNMCRACLMQDLEMQPLFSQFRLDEPVLIKDIFIDFASIQVSEDDDLPDEVCLVCLNELKRAISFKKLCQTSDCTLRSGVLLQQKPNCVKIEPIEETNFTTQIHETKMDINFAKQMYDVPSELMHVDSINDDKIDPVQPEVKPKLIKRIHRKRSYKCNSCNQVSKGPEELRRHIINEHKQVYKCTECHKSFNSQNILKRHISLSHVRKDTGLENQTEAAENRLLPPTCQICNKTFRCHSNLERHKLVHTGEKPYLCNVCGKSFTQLSYLKIHGFIHTGEKPYKCDRCDKSFAAPGTLLTHIRIHTGERPHVCTVCGKDFPQSGYLSRHMRIHTGEKNFECKVCHQRFCQSGRLSVHMRMHSGEKPYACKDCGRSFAVQETLKKHIRTHTGERPYVCNVCGQAFAQSGTLSTHMKVHAPK